MADAPDKAVEEARPPTATDSIKQNEPEKRPLGVGESLRSLKSVKSDAATRRVSGGTIATNPKGEESDDEDEEDEDEDEDEDEEDEEDDDDDKVFNSIQCFP